MDTNKRSRTAVFFQDACLAHRFIRSPDTSTIVERPQRLRAVKTGVATAIARLEQHIAPDHEKEDVLVTALERLDLNPATLRTSDVVDVVMSTAAVDLLHHAAVKYVHGDVDGDVYLERLVKLVKESENKVASGESEIPGELSQGDLYLCGESLDAIQGAIGTVCEAVDAVIGDAASGPSRAFVAIRPPGHHCGEDTPSGFCFVNNVAIGAAHAHLKHGISRVVVLDIDLHHGNGTQSIAWQINEETYRQQLEAEAETSDAPSGSKFALKMYYGSIHDVLSYPCEDGNASLIQAASVSLHGPHGQHIENVHLLPYASDAEFWDRLYPGPYARLLDKAEAFLKDSQGTGEAMVFISAGFDASEHEYASMSRHGRRVPTGFYHRFARDARLLADQYAKGRIVSVLEGGYSDRALCSGAMSHVLGLAEVDGGGEVDESWWAQDNLVKLEKATKKRRGGRASGATAPEKWVESAMSLLATFDPSPSPPPTPKPVPPSTMTLRDRSKRGSEAGTPPPKPQSTVGRKSAAATPAKDVETETGKVGTAPEPPKKKLPRVVLKVNPPTPMPQGA